ncbi:chaperone protein HscA [mine drainage metagenome]|uniref:Chaperone protein HscA n=1 Tax=mine drainage metagenome TaxID=410659 RepID=A0A1J5S2I8_9ZZZZ
MSSLLQIYEPGQTPAPHEREAGAAVGIDLGTTNSVVALALEGTAAVLPGADGQPLLPSVVAYAEDGAIVVGQAARAILATQPDRVISSVKRLMGRGAAEVKRLAGILPHALAPASDGGMLRLQVGERAISPVEVSAEILNALRQRAEAALQGRAVSRAVITVPAYFDDAARAATKDAARLAGLEVLRLVNEPTAAALAYGLDNGAEGLYAVYDLGGGTFDVSLLTMEKGVFQVLATGGDAALGGDDIDHAVAEHFLAERAAAGQAAAGSAAAKQALHLARAAKEYLSDHPAGEWTLEIGGQASRHALSRAGLEDLARPLVTRSLAICRAVIEEAGLTPDALQGVVLVGGSTRMPLVRAGVTALFGRPPLTGIDPDEVVAVGAARQAEALTGGADTLLLDVTPLSLGLETMGGIVEKVIPRNTPIPVALAQEFTTYQDGQTAMAIHVLQGEREMADQCRSLARFDLRGIPPMTAGAARIRVGFSVDADGLLTVSARETTTGTEQQVAVKPSYGLTDEEMAAMLRASQLHARDDMEARLRAEAVVEARRAALALRAALAADGDLLSPAERQSLDQALAHLEQACADGGRERVTGAAQALDEASQSFAERRMDRGIRQALAGQAVDHLSDALGLAAAATP